MNAEEADLSAGPSQNGVESLEAQNTAQVVVDLAGVGPLVEQHVPTDVARDVDARIAAAVELLLARGVTA